MKACHLIGFPEEHHYLFSALLFIRHPGIMHLLIFAILYQSQRSCPYIYRSLGVHLNTELLEN